MNKEQRTQLRRLAEAATPGEWPDYNKPEIREQLWHHYDWDKDRIGRVPICIPPSDSAYIAAANPATVLELLDRMDKLEKVAEAASSLRANALGFCIEKESIRLLVGNTNWECFIYSCNKVQKALSALDDDSIATKEQDDDTE